MVTLLSMDLVSNPVMCTRYHSYQEQHCQALTVPMDASKEFDKMLRNGLFVKMLRRNIGLPVCLVILLMFWYSHLQCSVTWNDELEESFSILERRAFSFL